MTAASPGRRTRATLVALVLGTACALAAGGPVRADDDDAWLDEPTPPAEAPSPSAQQLADSITVFTLDGVTTWVIDGVSPMETIEREGERTTITLATDILFAPDRWDIPANAQETIVDLLEDIPDGATVEVSGHTDSVVGAVDNAELSLNRAEAVAAVIADARPDLELDVNGYADSRPAVEEDPEDPSTYRENRRVEIVYEG